MSSNRVLSGSLTKGSTATLSGSVKYFYQGVNARTFDTYFGSLLPRVGSGNRTSLFKENSPVSKITFDDSIKINNTPDDLGDESDIRVTERIDFSYENRVLGQAPTTMLGEPFADILDFDPVLFIEDQNETMWPSSVWNAGALDNHEYDGVIEPLDIRPEIFGDIDTRYEGHSIRGSLTGGSSERPWGSTEISDNWKTIDNHATAFLDAPASLTGSASESHVSIQPFIDIKQSDDIAFFEEDYHDRVYYSLLSHNNTDMRTALRKLNSSSCETLTDPLEKTATKGLISKGKVGSLAFYDSFVIGEYK